MGVPLCDKDENACMVLLGAVREGTTKGVRLCSIRG